MRLRFAFAALVVLAGALAACGTPTPYAPAGPHNRYGFTTQRIEDGRFLVSFAGNALTDRQSVENALLFRAAQVTLANGGDYFEVVRRGTDPHTTWHGDVGGWPYYPGAWPYRGWYPGWSDGTAYPVSRYTAHAEILVRKGPKPQGDPNAFDARQVVRNLRPVVEQMGLPTAG